jgi:Replication protein
VPSVARERPLVKPTSPNGAPQASGPQGRLGRYANNSSPPRPTSDEKRKRKQAGRRERYRLRYKLRRITNLKRVRACGHTPVGNPRAGPTLRLSVLNGERVAGMTGLAHCGSVWACPACSAKIATRRAEELADVMRHALEQGCSASMVTLTMRHHEGQSLKDCWNALGKAWARVTSGKQWVSDQAAYGLVGWVKAVEVTHGKNGWHVHIHVLMIWRDKIGQAGAERVGQRMWNRWSRALQRYGFDSLRDSGGLDVRMATLQPGNGSGLHEYFVKLSHEITGGQAKLAKGGGRTPFQILSDAVEGLADDLDLWWQWERASLGRRQIAWSKGLREWAKLMPEQTDEEIAQEELLGEDLLVIPGWPKLRRSPDDVCDVHDAAERGGLAAAGRVLDRLGVEWFPLQLPPKPPPPPPTATPGPRVDNLSAAARDKLDRRRRLLVDYRRWYDNFAPDPLGNSERRIPARLVPRIAKSEPDRDAFIRELRRFNRSGPCLDV